MDQVNVFDTPVTARLHRAEYLVAFAATITLGIMHIGDIRWLPAVGLFLYIDLIGYIPGAIAYHRSTTKQISRVYYVLYNIMHSLITQAAVAGIWCLTVGPEWALLALPFHLFGDRALFGNFYKPFGLHFEPVREPGYTALVAEVTARTQVPPLPEAAASAPEPGAPETANAKAGGPDTAKAVSGAVTVPAHAGAGDPR
ncbi:hypothetical protein [Streptomyces jumonjinensis]|uniref:hypothetical protein n=1 Tax=Streptomyces jumonjinensis TaxID=1945 RepID=UPI00378C8C06